MPAVYHTPFMFIRIVLFIGLIGRAVALSPTKGNVATAFVRSVLLMSVRRT